MSLKLRKALSVNTVKEAGTPYSLQEELNVVIIYFTLYQLIILFEEIIIMN